MASQYTCAENLVMLAYHPMNGRFRVSQIHFNGILSGALLQDMIGLGYIHIQGKQIIPKVQALTGHIVYDDMLERLHKKKKPYNFQQFTQLVMMRAHKLLAAIREELIQRQKLHKKEKHLLGFIPINRYPATHPNQSALLIEQLRKDIIRPTSTFSERDWCLFGLLQIGQVFGVVFPDRKTAFRESKRIKKAWKKVNNSPVWIQQLLKDIETSITGVMTTTVF